MSSVVVAVHGKVVHKRQHRRRASSGGGRLLVHLTQLTTGRAVKAADLMLFDAVRVPNFPISTRQGWASSPDA